MERALKFNELAIGQQFEFDGVAYVKSGPFVASSIEGGKQKFMARYAVVRLVGEAAPVAKVRNERQLPADQVMAAFEMFYARCVALPGLSGQSRTELEQARKEFLDSLH